jgi:hypothetical protein
MTTSVVKMMASALIVGLSFGPGLLLVPFPDNLIAGIIPDFLPVCNRAKFLVQLLGMIGE